MAIATDNMLHPMVYTGPAERDQKTVKIEGRGEVTFERGTLSEPGGLLEGLRYAYVTEEQGKRLLYRAKDLFSWPDGATLGPQVVTRDEFQALAKKVTQLTAVLEQAGIKAADLPEEAEEAPKKKTRGPGKKTLAEAGAHPSHDTENVDGSEITDEAAPDGD